MGPVMFAVWTVIPFTGSSFVFCMSILGSRLSRCNGTWFLLSNGQWDLNLNGALCREVTCEGDYFA